MTLLKGIYWNFNQPACNTVQEFNDAVTQYQVAITRDASGWKPDEVIVDRPEVDIQYMVWVKGPEDIISNETLLEDEDFFEDEDNSDGELFQAEIVARFEAENDKNFTALELLYKIHQQMKTKNLYDHSFFEGLSDGGSDEAGVPRYFLDCGS